MTTGFRTASRETLAAQEAQRRILIDELIQHPDVWAYLSDLAAAGADTFPDGSVGRDVCSRLAIAANDLYGLMCNGRAL